MALSLNDFPVLDDFATARLPDHVQNLWAKVQSIECPLLKGMEPWIAMEQIFKPSELRIKFLQWIFCSIDENLLLLVDPPSLRNDTQEMKATRILKVAVQLKLCAAKEMDLIAGTASLNRQTVLFNLLFDILLARKRVDEENSRDTSFSDISSLSSESTSVLTSCTVTRNYLRHSTFIDNISAKGLVNVYQTRVLKVPRDIQQEMEHRRISPTENLKTCKKQQLQSAQLQSLKSKLCDLQDELDRQKQLWSKQEYFEPYNEAASKSVLLKMLLISRELSASETKFEELFSQDLEFYCHSSDVEFSPLGPMMSKLHSLTTDYENFFQSLKTLRATASDLTSSIPKSLDKIVNKGIQLKKLKNLEEWLFVLFDSVENSIAKNNLLPNFRETSSSCSSINPNNSCSRLDEGRKASIAKLSSVQSDVSEQPGVRFQPPSIRLPET